MRGLCRSVSAVALGLALASTAQAQEAGNTVAAPGTNAPPATEGGAANGTQGSAPTEGAETGIAEIVVTAQKRAENVQNVPIAISAFTSTALQERAVTTVAALSNLAPNVTLDAGTPFSGSSSVLAAYVRGIGSNDFAFNIDPGVGIYLDGVYLARSVGANQELPDVERIEVLKGPQGTLFGRNTIGGAISIVTHDPGRDFRFTGDITTGSFRLFQARGTMDVPLTDQLSSSVSFSVKRRDGYLKRIPFPGASAYQFDPGTSFNAAGYDRTGLGREGGDNVYNLRGKIKWDNGGRLKFVGGADYSRIDQEQIANKVIKTVPSLPGGNGNAFNVFAGTYNCAIAGQSTGCGNGPPSFAYAQPRGSVDSLVGLAPLFGVNVDANPNNNRLPYDDRFIAPGIDRSYATGNNFQKLTNWGLNGTISYELSDTITLKSISAYRELHWKVGQDLDNSPLTFLATSFSLNQKQYSEEVQLLGSALDKKLNFVLGGYYFNESGDLHDYVTFAEGILQVDGPNNLSTQNFAAFGQIDYRPIDLVSFTVGGRFTRENKKFEGFQGDVNGLNYKILNFLGVPGCESLSPNPISEQCRIAAGFPNPGQPLRYYIAGVQKKSFNNFAPKLGLQLHPGRDLLVYGSWSKGYKTGGYTTRLSNPLPTAPGFGVEKATTWELGVKSTLFDRRLQLNAAAFTTRYTGIQLNFQQGVSPVVQNAGDARIKGFEVEAVAAFIRGFTLTGSVGYLDAYYTSVDGPAVVPPNALQAGVAKGISLPKTPHWKFNISPRYQIDLGSRGKLIALANFTHTTPLKNDTEGTFLLDRPTTDILDVNLTYQEPGGRWSLTAGGTNVTDERYLVTGQAQLAGGQIYGTYSRPAEWYLRLGVKF